MRRFIQRIEARSSELGERASTASLLLLIAAICAAATAVLVVPAF